MRSENLEFCKRILKNKESFVYSPKAIVYHPVENSRTNKAYFYSYYFNFGRTKTIITELTENVALFKGVPRYRIKILINKVLSCLFETNSKTRFSKINDACQLAGELYEYYNIYKNKYNL